MILKSCLRLYVKNIISDRCAHFKFDSQAGAYFKQSRKFASIKDLQNASSSIPEETFCLVTDFPPSYIHLDGFFLCEALKFIGENTYSLTAIKREGCSIDLTFPIISIDLPISSVSLSLICTQDDMYVDFLKRVVKHYSNVFKSLCSLDISIAYFGPVVKDKLKFLTTYNTGTLQCLPDKFDMAFARNKSLDNCKSDYVLMMDLDCYLSREQLLSLIKRFITIPHHGIFNIKKTFKSGNGLYFGCKSVLQDNRYNEEFKEYWFEDTEYIMNFSRRGVIPFVEFVDFEQVDHSRAKTLGTCQKNNKQLFEKILKYGR